MSLSFMVAHFLASGLGMAHIVATLTQVVGSGEASRHARHVTVVATEALAEEVATAWDVEEECGATADDHAALSLRQLRASSVKLPVNSSAASGNASRRREGEGGVNTTTGVRGLPGGWGEAEEYLEALLGRNHTASPVVDGRASGADERTAFQKPIKARGPFAGSCHAYGCHQQYVKAHRCQCTRSCSRNGDCCSDYWSTCKEQHHVPEQPKNVITLFHQTGPQAGPLILKHGFQVGRRGWCGPGIYFARKAKDTNTKAIGPDSHKGFLIEAQVDVGRVEYMPPTCDASLNGPKVWRDHFDSVSFDPGDGVEFVVYSATRILSTRQVGLLLRK